MSTDTNLLFAVSCFAFLVVMGIALVRAFIGPSVYDRVLAVNMFGTKTVLFIALFGFLTGRPDFLDIALVYALSNFISVIAVLRFVEHLTHPESRKTGSDSSLEGE